MNEDLISRKDLIKNLQALESVTRNDKAKFRWDSVYRTVNTAKQIDGGQITCTECVMKGLWANRVDD